MAASGSKILQRFEQRLEGAVEGFFARAFRSGLQPVELAKGLQRYADGHRDVTNDGIVVPNEYAFSCHPRDLSRLEGYGASLLHELAEVVAESAAEHGWQLRGPAVVTLTDDDDVRVGTFRLRGRVAANPTPPQDLSPPAQRADAGAGLPPDDGPGPDGVQRDHVGADRARADDRREDHAEAAAPPAATPPPAASNGQPATPAATPAAAAPGATTSQSAAVRIDTGPTAGTVVPLRGARVVCGRMPESNIVLDDVTVSRSHAAFVRRGDQWWVLDLGSTNGTRVNGRKAAEHPVQPGDRVEFGDARVEIVGP